MLLGLEIILFFVAIYLLYVRNRELKKPCFVHAIWILMGLQIATAVSYQTLKHLYNKKDYADESVYAVIYTWVNRLEQTTFNLNTLTHWILTVEYFALAVHLWQMKNDLLNRKGTKQRRQRVKCTIRAVNLSFYALVIGSWAY